MQLAWTDRHLQYWASKSGVDLNCGNAKDDWKDEERYSSFEERDVSTHRAKKHVPLEGISMEVLEQAAYAFHPCIHKGVESVALTVMLFYLETSWSKCRAKSTK